MEVGEWRGGAKVVQALRGKCAKSLGWERVWGLQALEEGPERLDRGSGRMCESENWVSLKQKHAGPCWRPVKEFDL